MTTSVQANSSAVIMYTLERYIASPMEWAGVPMTYAAMPLFQLMPRALEQALVRNRSMDGR